ncbi:hypothetical protein DRE_01011 [Drechslerella stenobrocha 248]|uniref:Uncharacterized protein n=1 Tax=Drechslerella stenobrocha 248 TaxID=1043628 RepID=W7HXR7_9PEZI|nr:hypothetical protein DRE_01011 [Drechslerella stenobrocha 248]
MVVAAPVTPAVVRPFVFSIGGRTFPALAGSSELPADATCFTSAAIDRALATLAELPAPVVVATPVAPAAVAGPAIPTVVRPTVFMIGGPCFRRAVRAAN